MELVKSISVKNLLNQINAIQDRLISAQKALLEADQICTSAGIKDIQRHFSGYHRSNISFLAPDGVGKTMKEIQASAWELLMNESGLKSFMSATRRKEWDEVISKGDFPEMTEETIRATFENIHSDRNSMFEQGVVECFRNLSWDYKTNLPCKFGKRIIIAYLMNSYGSVNSRSTDHVDDLLRAFCILDNKPEPDYRQRMYFMIRENESKGFYENEYFSLKWFKKGTGHLTFKRKDLVTKLNDIIAKHHPNVLPSRT